MSRWSFSRRSLGIAAVLVPLGVLLVYVALRSGPLAPIAVTVVKAENRTLRPALYGVGQVEARQVHRLGATAPGRILRLEVDVGDTVRAGQRLGEIDPVDAESRLRAQEALVKRTAATLADATARHAFAQSQAQRYEQLHADRVVTQELFAARRQDLQLAGAALAAAREDRARAQADLQALQAQRNGLRLVAPVDGVVTARDVEQGTTVVAGQTILEVVAPESLWVHARFDQVSAGGLSAGLPARVALRSRRDAVMAGRIQRVELRADSVTEELLAKVAFDGAPQPLPPIGERAEVTVDLPPFPVGPVIPNAAIQRLNQQVGVWVVQGEGVVFVPLQLGRADLEGWVQVRQGLKAGDTMVWHSDRPLNARSRVHVVERLPGVAP